MKRFTIYCTKKQSEKAYNLGAPIDNPKHVFKHVDRDIKDCYAIVSRNDEYLFFDFITVEQMCGWLRDNGFIVFVHGLNDGYEWVVESKHGIDRGEANAYEKAMSEAIDIALGYLGDAAVEDEELKNNTTPVSCNTDDYVDLGLPSGNKWAKCNVGANSEEEYGSYYKFDEAIELFKSRNDKMPSKDDFEELTNNTNRAVTDVNGVYGMRFTSKINGNSIFVPFSGYAFEGSVGPVGDYAYVWSSSVDGSDLAWSLLCRSLGRTVVYSLSRYYGLVLRPVCGSAE